MTFERVLGQPTAVTTLTRAIQNGQLHHAYRFEGPEGVGKTLCAMAFAQALVCETPGALGCGSCRACELALTTSAEPPHVPLHPDVVVVARGLYPPAMLGRSTPENTGISVQQIRRLVLPRTGYAPHEGRALCFIIKDADELTIAAANALLKTLEEPAPNTFFVLLTSRPGQLLDTVRSRTLAVRFAPLSDALVQRLGASDGVTEEVAALAQGSVSLALELADEETQKRRQSFVDAAFQGLEAPDLAGALGFANQRAEGRDELRSQLLQLAQVIANSAREAASTQPETALRAARRHRVLLRALDAVSRNAQPALLLESMIAELRGL